MFGFTIPEIGVIFLACALGVALSIAIPILRKALGLGGESDSLGASGGLWAVLRPYVIFAVLSLAVALVIVFTTELKYPKAGFVAGYLFDSTLQKITGKP